MKIFTLVLLASFGITGAAFAAQKGPKPDACEKAAIREVKNTYWLKSDAYQDAAKEKRTFVFGETWERKSPTVVEVDVEYGDSREDAGETSDVSFSVTVQPEGPLCAVKGATELK